MLNYSKTAVFLLILLAISCTPKKKEAKIEKNKSLFEKGLVVATIKGKKIEEASGLVTSAINPGMFWTHNDSGADAELFLIDQEGNIHLKVFLAGPNPSMGRHRKGMALTYTLQIWVIMMPKGNTSRFIRSKNPNGIPYKRSSPLISLNK